MRPETGPMQFGNDWPGVFIRGDDAFGMAMYLRALIESIPPGDDLRFAANGANKLINWLESSDVRHPATPAQLKPYTDCLPPETPA